MSQSNGGSGDAAQIESLLSALDPAEKVALASGIDTWHTAAAPSIGLPSIKVTDGPSGARGGSFGAVASASFPCASALGATWNTSLIYQVGVALAQEAVWKGARVLLAPTINIQRHPLGGRHFECYSEDPFLTARLAVSCIAGVQSRRVAATPKHFVCNDTEFERHTISSDVSERAQREIYFPPFEAAIVEGGAWALMAAYNKINGAYAAENRLLVELVKGEWGFDGLVMSDWWGTMSTVASANNGLDLEMPGPPVHFGSKLSAAVQSGQVSPETVNDKARRLIRLARRVNAFEDPLPDDEQEFDDPGHAALLRKAATEAVVLLKNDGLLPMDPAATGTVAIIGPLGERMSMQGGGSAYVEPHRSASLLSAVRALSSADVSFSPGCRIFREPPPLREGLSVLIDGTEMAGALVSYFNSPEFEGEAALQQRRRRMHVVWLGEPVPGKIEGQFSARVTANYTAAESGLHRFTLVSAGRSRVFIDDHCVVDNWDQWERGTSFYGAGSTMVEGSISLEAGRSSTMVLEYSAPETPGVRGVTLGCMPPDTTDLIDQAVAVAGSVDAVVLVVGTTGETEKEGTDRTTLQLPGEQDELVRRVLAANPRTVVVVNAGSPVAMPWVADAPAVLWTWFPGQQGDEAVADILFGQKDPGGRLPMTMPVRVEDCPAHATYPGQDGTVTYSDDVFVGYRGYRRHGVTPLYPFGHGLSYTEFRLEPMVLDRTALRAGEPLTVTVGISNVGQRTGSHVVQLYVGDTESRLPRPDRELKGFAKVQLAPGERTEVTFNLGLRSFAAWDPEVRDWLVEPGEFEVMIGSSSADISQSRTVTCLDPIGASAPDQS